MIRRFVLIARLNPEKIWLALDLGVFWFSDCWGVLVAGVQIFSTFVSPLHNHPASREFLPFFPPICFFLDLLPFCWFTKNSEEQKLCRPV